MFSPLYLDNFISATQITPQVGKRARRARRPRRSKLRIFRFRASTKAQSLRCFSSPHKAVRLCGVPKTGEREKRAVGSLGRLHHAAQFVWTHNVRPARKTGCRGWGCKQSRPLPRAVRAAKLCPRCSPSPGRELQIRRKRKP